MLAKARDLTDTVSATATLNKITYEQQNLEDRHFKLPAKTYDLVYSCFAFHYLPHDALVRVFAQIAQCLRPGGRLVFAVEHPIWTAPSDATWKQTEPKLEADSNLDGEGGGGGGGGLYWPLNCYFDEGLRVRNWLDDENVHKYHRTTETYISLLLRHNFVLTGFRESWDDMPEPFKPESLEKFKGFHMPFFLMISARLNDSGMNA